jgi:two-component system NtrC family sensor kinase
VDRWSGEGAGVASRWRIRHKLMLGLGLVVATMVLLLGGTVEGVWSYYLDMNSLRVLTTQLRSKAEKVKTAVSNIRPKLLEMQTGQRDEQAEAAHLAPAKEPEAPEELNLLVIPEEEGELSQKRKPRTAREALEQTREALNDYENTLSESSTLESSPRLRHSLDPEGLIGKMREGLDSLSQRLERDLDKKRPSPLEVFIAPNEDDRKIDAQQQEKWPELHPLELQAEDLRSFVDTEIQKRIDHSRRNYQITLWIAVPASIVGLLLVIGLLGSFYAWVFHPIRDLEAGVIRVAKGDFDHRIEVHSGDEMEDLGTAFNDMMQRLQDLYSDLARQVNERSRQLVRSERLASVGFLAAGVAHEINNPLASIAFCSEALEARLNDLLRHLHANSRFDEEHEIFSKYLKMIQEEAFRCKNITERLLAFSRPGEVRREKIDLRELVQLVLDVTQHLPNHRGKEIVFEMNAERLAAGESISAWVNSEEIKSVVLNLVVNALDSMDEGGKLTIRLGQRGDMAELQFSDTGCGMTQEVLENIFEPFYTRSRTGKGTGLGLTISHRIITQHGGEIEASSPGPNRGSTFVVRLPVRAPEVSPVLPGPGLPSGKKEEQAVPARAA